MAESVFQVVIWSLADSPDRLGGGRCRQHPRLKRSCDRRLFAGFQSPPTSTRPRAAARAVLEAAEGAALAEATNTEGRPRWEARAERVSRLAPWRADWQATDLSWPPPPARHVAWTITYRLFTITQPPNIRLLLAESLEVSNTLCPNLEAARAVAAERAHAPSVVRC